MTTEENKQLVLNWIQSGCNYEQGAVFYNQFGKNKFLKKDFPGKQYKHATKIIYELCKSVGLDYAQLQREKLIQELEEKPIKMLPSTASRVRLSTHAEGSGSKALISASVPEFLVSELVEDVEGMEVKNSTEYPPILRRINAEYAELFQERSKMHRIMTEMPEGNSQSLKTKRAEIFDIIKSLSARLE